MVRELASRAEGKPVPLAQVTEASGLAAKQSKVLVAWLTGAGILERGSRGLRRVRDFETPEELDTYLHAYEERHQDDRDKLQRMMHYGQTTECRWRVLGDYFDEPMDEDCGHCDNCRERAAGHFDVPPPTSAPVGSQAG